MSLLPAPIIEGTLPAFYLDDDGTAIIAVPFFMSRAVNQSEVLSFRLKIKNIQGSAYIITIPLYRVDYAESIAYFKIAEATLKNSFLVGQFYKAQLAYVNLKGEVGVYSSVGVLKYTTKPRVSILDLKESVYNSHCYSYTGVYSQEEKGADTTEKAYAYKFVIRDEHDEIVKDTGFIVHNSSNDEYYYKSYDSFSFPQDLKPNKKYTITYTVKTNNNLEESTPPYKLMQKKYIESDLSAKLHASLNYENGYVNLWLESQKNDDGFDAPIQGTFTLSRASHRSDFMDWTPIAKFSLTDQSPSARQWQDFTIEQGVRYKYSIQQYSPTLLSERIVSEEIIYADFEDCFLYDGKRQLKIKYNPKVSSFKKDLLEQKTDTLGSKYPFIFRNGQVEYKEFSISGLISYFADNECLFLPEYKDLFFNQERHESLIYSLHEENPFVNIKKGGTPSLYYKNNNYLFYYILKSDGTYEKWTDYAKQLPARKVRLEGAKHDTIISINANDWTSVFNYYTAASAIGAALPTPPEQLYYREMVSLDRFKPEEQILASTQLTSENIFFEREYKLEVLNWLTNGEPKLFKSPGEGNYVVRLMNVSLSPNDQVNRMLHTFNATAYEVADLNYESLIQYNLIPYADESKTYLKIVTVPLSTKDGNYVELSPLTYELDTDTGIYYIKGSLLKPGIVAQTAYFYDVPPGTKFLINDSSVVIGSTGTYNVPIEAVTISLDQSTPTSGFLTISYMSEIYNAFNQAISTSIKEVLGQQIIGKHDNIISNIENIERNIIAFYDIRMYERPLENASYLEQFNEESEENIASLIYGQETIASWTVEDGKFPSKHTSYDNIKNQLLTYKYEKESDSVLGDLFVRVRFANTGMSDVYSNYNRNLENRTSGNPYLYDVREFLTESDAGNLYYYVDGEFVTTQGFTSLNPNYAYFVKEKIQCVYIPQEARTIYLTPFTHNQFKLMWTFLKENGNLKVDEKESIFLEYYLPYEEKVLIDGEQKDLSNITAYSTGPIEKITELTTTSGVYCELFYQAQIINYDISQNSDLQKLKFQLENYSGLLERDYMYTECISQGRETEYIELLEETYRNYALIYNTYITDLKTYLDSFKD